MMKTRHHSDEWVCSLTEGAGTSLSHTQAEQVSPCLHTLQQSPPWSAAEDRQLVVLCWRCTHTRPALRQPSSAPAAGPRCTRVVTSSPARLRLGRLGGVRWAVPKVLKASSVWGLQQVASD